MTEPTEPDVQQTISRQFIYIALATAPSYMALALVRFTELPVVGWVLLVVSAVACAVLIARATGSLGAEHPALRQNAIITILMCTAAPVIAILAILFLPD